MARSELPSEVMRISWGPQHPMSGQIRILIDTDGERVFDIIPDLGFTHRGMEKMLEHRTFYKGIVPMERVVMADCANTGLSYILAAEEALGVEVPMRAQYIRTILCEISRINSHLYALGLIAESAGGYPAIFLWSTGDREPFLDLAEMLTGARWSYSFFVPGGVREDLPNGFKEKALEVCDYFEKRLETYRKTWLENEIFESRSRGVGILSREDALGLGAAGPSLRGSGVPLDVRRNEPYAAYGEIEFEVATQEVGDSFDRLMVRNLEMIESVEIIRQAVKNIPEGPVKTRVSFRAKAPEGEAYSRVETARGEMGVHMVTDGGETPYRVKISSPSFRNLFVFFKMPELGEVMLADVPVILYSIDPWYLDSDR